MRLHGPQVTLARFTAEDLDEIIIMGLRKKKSSSLVYFQYKNALKSANQTGSQVPVSCSMQMCRISISRVNKAEALRGSDSACASLAAAAQDREVSAEVLQGSGLDFGTSASENVSGLTMEESTGFTRFISGYVFCQVFTK